MRVFRHEFQAGNVFVLLYQEIGSRWSISHRLFTDAVSIAWSEASLLARCHNACRLWPSDSAICSHDKPAERANEIASFWAASK
jgi:hypothetical protein